MSFFVMTRMRRIGLLCSIAVAGVVLADEAVGQSTLTFRSGPDLVVGDSPRGIVVGQFNNDESADIIVALNGSEALAVLLGDGRGGFIFGEEPVFTGSGPAALATADMDNDSLPDLVLTDDVENTVVVLLGNGDGTFQELSVQSTGDAPEGVAVIDVDDDDLPDVVTANTFSDTLGVLINVDRGFFAPTAFLRAPTGPCGIIPADFDDDGRADIAVSSVEGVVAVYLGNGDGTFRGTGCPGDCNGDGQVTVDELVRGVGIALERLSIENCLAFDSNADRLVTINELVLAVSTALNGCTFRTYAAGTLPAGIAAGDVNEDGAVDIVVADDGSDFISVLLGFGNGTFAEPRTVDVGGPTRGLVLSDFDGDATLDIAATDPAENEVVVLRGEGDATFSDPLRIAVGLTPSGSLGCQGIVVADLNGDRRPEIVTANESSGDISILFNETE